MKLFVAAAAAAAAAQALNVEELHIGEFNLWKQEHGKEYADVTEETLRYENFLKNKEKIETHNKRLDRTYTMALNHFADLTPEEFRQQNLGYRPLVGHTSTAERFHIVSDDTPKAKDWRDSGVVTDIKDQGDCGSCWAFSTTGSVEAANLIKNGGSAHDRKNILSEQQLVDCSTANSGCNGGLMDMAFNYLKRRVPKGDDTEASYPYTANDGKCKRLKGTPSHIRVTGHVDVKSGDEEALRNAVGTVGPVSIAIEADQSAFQFYSDGIISSDCGEQLDHGVLAVGYGSEGGQDYWIVKNSWGKSWGEGGYVRIAMGQDLCGIANEASYPIVAKTRN